MSAAAYVLVLFRQGRRYAERDAHAAGHEAFVTSLVRRNLVVLGGDFGDVVGDVHAAYLVRSQSADAARTVVADDPFFVHEVFDPVAVEWNLVGVNTDAVDAADVLTPHDV